MTHRSDLVDKIADALTDEAYDGGMGPMSEKEFPRYVRRLAETAAEVVASVHGEPSAVRTASFRCDYCGGALPKVKDRQHLPTVPLLQRMGFDAHKLVCPECVEREDIRRWLLRDFASDTSPLGRSYLDVQVAAVLRRTVGTTR